MSNRTLSNSPDPPEAELPISHDKLFKALFRSRPQPLAAALAALMHSEIWDQLEKKLRCLQAISRAEGLGISQRYLLAKVVDTYVQLTAEDERRFAQAVASEANEEVRNMIVTWDEALADKEARGRAEGEAKGRVIGHIEAAQEAALRAARRRFGPLPRGFEEKIRAIEDLERLYEILDRTLEARSLAGIDLEPTRH